MTDKPVLFDIQGAIALITLNRPTKRNAINGEVSAGIERAIDIIEEDKNIRVAILTGAGPVFCSGADLKAVQGAVTRDSPTNIVTKKGGFAGIVRRERRKPIIAALQGDALAGGFEIALACDLIVAADHMNFTLPEAARSLIATAGALNRLPRLIGLNRTQQLILTGEPINASKAEEWGIVNYRVSSEDVLNKALSVAKTIAAHSPLAVQANRRLAADAFDLNLQDHFRKGFKETTKLYQSKDAAEGIAAFLEKRDPIWTGE